ncbi:MAG TPA: hypothetical protein VFL65_00865 [Jatrophihabitans sp.]|nr:hypothetical protein [Jatrophihabitans sp.]
MSNVGYATLQIIPSMKSVSASVGKQLGASSAAAGAAGAQTGRRFGGGFGASVKGIAKTMGAIFAVTKVASFFKESVKGAEENAAIQRVTAQVIKTTGGAAGVTREHVEKLSMSIAQSSGVSDEAAQSMANMLLTFTNIRNSGPDKIFDQTARAAQDMAAAVHIDGVSAAQMLGKALNDPAAGMTKLMRSGVTFTDAQKKQVAAMQKSGNVLGAQKIILGEVSKEFGGAAAAAATPSQKLHTMWGRLQVMVGLKLIPVIDKLVGFLTTKVIPALMKVADFVSRNSAIIKPLVAVVLALVAVWKAWAVAQAIWNAVAAANPILLIVMGLVALGAALVLAWKKSETFRAIVTGAFNVVKAVALAVFDWLVVKPIQALTTMYNGIKAAFGWVVGFMKKWGPLALAVLLPFIGIPLLIWQHFGKIKDYLSNAWSAGYNMVKSWVGKIVGFVTGLPGQIAHALSSLPRTIAGMAGAMLNAGKAMIGGFWNGLKNVASGIADVAGSIWAGIKKFLNEKFIDKIRHIGFSKWGVSFHPFSGLPHFAHGGMTTGPMAAIMGDNPGGREVALPLNSGRTIAALSEALAQAGAAGGGGVTIERGAVAVYDTSGNPVSTASKTVRRIAALGKV